MSDPANTIRVRLRPEEPSSAFVQTIAGVRILSDAPLASGAIPGEPFDAESPVAGSPVAREIYDGPGWLAGRLERIRSSLLATGDTRIDFEDGDRYLVSIDAIRRLAPATRTPASDVERLLGAPLATALARRGVFLLHASAVRLEDGSVVALTAESGGGKSTLAAAAERFPELGLTRVADDQLPVRLGRSPAALPHFPQLKLQAGEQYPPESATSCRLRALIEIEIDSSVTTLDLVRHPPSAAIQALVRATVAAKILDRELLARHFDACAAAALETPVYRLRYPYGLDRLGEALAALARLPG